MIHAGVHAPFVWEIVNGELIIACQDARVGELTRIPVSNQFNNAEQATWFAQAKIDTQLEHLEALLADKRGN